VEHALEYQAFEPFDTAHKLIIGDYESLNGGEVFIHA
jgi:hypothetical protein